MISVCHGKAARMRATTKPEALLVILSSTWWITSCVDEDRMATVSCAPPPSDFISVSTGPWGTSKRSTGFVNTRHFEPGTIVELKLTAGGGGRGSGDAVYRLNTSDGDFLPLLQEDTNNDIAGANFFVQLDPDVARTAGPVIAQLKQDIVRRSGLVLENSKRRVLRDPVELTNSDGRAMTLIRDGDQSSRFIVVSAVSYGRNVLLGYYWATLLVNFLHFQNFNLHLNYVCSPLAEMNSAAQASGKDVPILFFYVALKYDRATASIVIDPAPLDLASFEIALRTTR